MEKYEVPFINACIRAFARRFDIALEKSYEYLRRHKGVSFLIEFYDVEHLQSIDDTVDDLILICKQNGGTLS